MPLSVGGSISQTQEIEKLLIAGADKVVLGKSILNDHQFLKSVIKNFGSQIIIASVDINYIDKDYEIILFTDSNYVKDGITKWIHNWKKNNWQTAAKKPVKNSDLWKELDTLHSERTVLWKWVKGHAGDPGNERADELARMGIINQ